MSRFRPRLSPAGAVLEPFRQAVSAAAPPRPVAAPPAPVSTPTPVRQPQTSTLQRFGFLALCAYIISAILNEWAIRLVGNKAYLSMATLVALPVVWLISGTVFRGLRHMIGWLWLGFLAWMVIATPFSVWRGGSVQLLTYYVPRDYVFFFFIPSLVGSLRDCRRLMYINSVVAVLILITCAIWGRYAEDGRYYVPGGAGFFQNSNELAMQLLLGVVQFVFIFSQKWLIGKGVAIAAIPVSLLYIIRTGSRGAILALLAYGLVLLYTSRHKVRVAVVGLVLVVSAVSIAPSKAVNRLMLLLGEDRASVVDVSAVESETSRVDLLKRSVSETIQHPLFGVGPGMFAVAVFDEAQKKHQWTQWLGTHNSYTEVSSECGIPAFICYIGVIVVALRLSFKIWKRLRFDPSRADVSSLALALFSAVVVYAVSAFFFHMAYSHTLPVLAGQTLALHFAVRNELKTSSRTI